MPTATKVEKPRIRNSAGQYSSSNTLTPASVRKAYGRPRLSANFLSRASLMFSAKTEAIHFDSRNDLVSDKVDTVNAIIRGVSVMTGGLIARGHDLEVDQKTLKQVVECATKKGGQIPVKVDHKSGAAAVCGYLTNFHIDGQKVKADWHLLKSHPQKEQILETAERMPRGVGLSAAFIGGDKPEITDSGRKAARCAELLSVDYVTLPAANPDGMFDAKVDSPNGTMNPELIAAIEAAIAKAVAPLSEKIAAQEKFLKRATTPVEALPEMSEQELADLGLTKADVDAVLAEIEQINAEGGEGEIDPATGQPIADPALATAASPATTAAAPATTSAPATAAAPAQVAAPAAAAPAGASVGLDAVLKQIVALNAEIKALKGQKEVDAEATLFGEITEKVDLLIAENAHLREAVKSGGKALSSGVERTYTFDAKAGEFEKLVQLSVDEKKLTKSQAFAAVIRENPEAYHEYLARRGVIKASE